MPPPLPRLITRRISLAMDPFPAWPTSAMPQAARPPRNIRRRSLQPRAMIRRTPTNRRRSRNQSIPKAQTGRITDAPPIVSPRKLSTLFASPCAAQTWRRKSAGWSRCSRKKAPAVACTAEHQIIGHFPKEFCLGLLDDARQPGNAADGFVILGRQICSWMSAGFCRKACPRCTLRK